MKYVAMTLLPSELVQCDRFMSCSIRILRLAQDATVLCRKQISFIALDFSWLCGARISLCFIRSQYISL